VDPVGRQSTTMSVTPQNETGAAIQEWNTKRKYTDFCLQADSGEEFKCHKERLAKCSSFFSTMFENDFLETKNSCMQVAEFKAETILHCLEYIYTDAREPADIKALKESAQPGEYIYNRRFNQDKFTPELLNMAHLYDLKDLQEDCIQYLKQNISGENAVGAWFSSKRCGNQSLRESAMTHLVEAQIRQPDSEVCGFEDIENSKELLKELMKFAFQDMHTKKHTKQEVYVYKSLQSAEEVTKGYYFTKWIESMTESLRRQEVSSGKKAGVRFVIFLDTKEKAEFVSEIMNQNGWSVLGSIDDGWSQDPKKEVIIAVKVSARAMVNLNAHRVLNYDFPDSIEEYECRLKLVSKNCLQWSWFNTTRDKKLAEEVIKVLLNAKQRVNDSLIHCWLDYKKSQT